MIALVDSSKIMSSRINNANYFFSPEELIGNDLHKYKVIFINGNGSGTPLKLSYEAVRALWRFVEQGGILYGEMINCEDFPSSRLFGFKQDFVMTHRRLEKIRINVDSSFCREGKLLEWQGPFLSGFTFETEILLDIGRFQETHQTKASGGQPGVIVKSLGIGKIIYSAISFLGNNQLWTLRPNWLWNRVVAWLKEEYGLPIKEIPLAVQITNTTDIEQSMKKGIDWFLDSGILPKEDGGCGIYENIHSIRGDVSKDFRPDCHVHTALMFFLYGKYTKDSRWTRISQNLLNYIFKNGYQDLDSESRTYGFWKWYMSPRRKPDQIFSDDNGWIAFVLLYLFRQTGREEYKDRGLLTAYSLLKTQNEDGCRPEVLRGNDLLEKDKKASCMNPHFESIVHSAFIQAYLITKDEAFLLTAKRGTLHLLNHFHALNFMYSKTSGLSRFLLALSHVYGMTMDEAIREGITKVMDYLQTHQHERGGIEEADNPKPERYGTEDTGVFRYNGEGIADQLYTNNFLAINAWEAWKVTENPLYKDFHKNLVNYLAGIQISSTKKEFDGAWMRSFHFEKGEYFGNNGDTGWGPYCIESGWTNANILSGMILRELDLSLLD